MTVRIGQGLDVHAFQPGNHIMLGGMRIPHHHGVAGHSDGDVALHALCDALLGALAFGDIGDSDRIHIAFIIIGQYRTGHG